MRHEADKKTALVSTVSLKSKAFLQMQKLTGILSGYFSLILAASACLLSARPRASQMSKHAHSMKLKAGKTTD
jgi:hypothetical protein